MRLHHPSFFFCTATPERLVFLFAVFFFALLLVFIFFPVIRLGRSGLGLLTTRLRPWHRLRWSGYGNRRTWFHLIYSGGRFGFRPLRWWGWRRDRLSARFTVATLFELQPVLRRTSVGGNLWHLENQN